MINILKIKRSLSRPVTRLGAFCTGIILAGIPLAAQASPNGTWLSKPQIWFHASNQTLDAVMARMQKEQYDYVFLDYRNVDDEMRQQVFASAKKHDLSPIVWIQSPQLRAMTIEDMIQEASDADGLQVDDHFFEHYSQQDFQALRAQYDKKILCSIQPFQVNKIPTSGCDQLDVQCYTPASFQQCMALANNLNAVLSLSSTSTISHQKKLEGRAYNIFLWPHSNDYRHEPFVVSSTRK
jgi:hypothetical protein